MPGLTISIFQPFSSLSWCTWGVSEEYLPLCAVSTSSYMRSSSGWLCVGTCSRSGANKFCLLVRTDCWKIFCQLGSARWVTTNWILLTKPMWNNAWGIIKQFWNNGKRRKSISRINSLCSQKLLTSPLSLFVLWWILLQSLGLFSSCNWKCWMLSKASTNPDTLPVKGTVWQWQDVMCVSELRNFNPVAERS